MKMWRTHSSGLLKSEDIYYTYVKDEDCIMKTSEDWKFENFHQKWEENEDPNMRREPQAIRLFGSSIDI